MILVNGHELEFLFIGEGHIPGSEALVSFWLIILA